MESDKYISVKDQAPDGSLHVVVVDMHNNNAVTKKPMKAEATLMHMSENVIALKGRTEGVNGHFIQVFNLDTKDKLGVHQFSESVIFWKWIGHRELAIVTETCVFHWSLTESSAVPEKVFDRAGKLADPSTQIISYAVNRDMSWCLLTGISTPDGGKTIEGSMQLYSSEKKQQQLLEGHAGTFGEAPIDDSGKKISLFCFMERKHGQVQTRLHILDLSRSSSYKVAQDIQMPADAPTDFAVALHLSEKHGVVYAVTKAGNGFVFDVQTGALLFTGKVSAESVFIGCPSERSGGMLFVNRKGQVTSFGINEQAIVEYITSSLNHPNRAEIAMNLGRRFGLPGVDYTATLRTMIMTNSESAARFAITLLVKSPPLMDIQVVVDMFLGMHKLQETTSILLEVLKPNLPEQSRLQTKLLEINLIHNPQVAEAIFQMGMLSHYDRPFVANLCEKAGLYQRAMEHYTELSDIKRCMLHSHTMSPEFLTKFIGGLVADTSVEIMSDMLRYNRQQNMQIVVQCAIKFHEQMGIEKISKLFEAFQCYDGLFFFLGGILASSTDPEVHFKYIEAASRLGHVQEVERVCRESKHYDAVRVKDFLKSAKLPDPRPLIYVCDLHGYIEELTGYLYKNNLMKYIEVYVVKVNPGNCPRVIGGLIDLDCQEDVIKGLLANVKSACPVGPLVDEVEKRNRIKIIQPWLEARVAEGSTEPALHNAMAKVVIDMGKEAESYLKNNAFYESSVVGKYCESRDPNLAYIAYRRAWGTCDEALIEVTNKNGMYRQQARYLVERQSPELWALVLDPTNEHRRQIVDQVVSVALPETTDQYQVSAAVKAFIEADLPHELIELLEKIVLRNGQFGDNKNLQNLLILTAIRADKSRVMDYVNRLSNFDGAEIAKVALGEPYNLFEEAFQIYKKFQMNNEAMDTLLTNLDNLDRATEFAGKVNDKHVWYKLGHAQLQSNMVPECMTSFSKAEDPRDYMQVIEAAESEEYYDQLIVFLRMARAQTKDPHIDTELLYCLAKGGDRASDLEEFLASPNTANIQSVGDRLFDERLFKSAKLLFASIPNFARLASCLVCLGEFTAAIEAAKKANNTKTWKEIASACVAAGEFRTAQTAGQHVVTQPDHIEDLIGIYEKQGHFNELITLLESGIVSDGGNVATCTELGILYAKYKANKLFDYIKIHASRLNIPKVIRACEQNQLWKEAIFLHVSYDEADAAASMMMLHSPSAWNHEEFINIAKKLTNSEIYYRAIAFYLEEHPLLLNSFLQSVAPKLDHSRVITQMRRNGHLALILEYLQSVQGNNVTQVNDAINELLLESEDIEQLRDSITDYDNFDQLGLAGKLEKHDLKEMRRLAALLYAKNKKYAQSVELSKTEGSFHDAIQAARESGSTEFAENLLRFFVDNSNKECFAACLYSCYDFLRPDVVMELGWRNGLTDLCMPYFIQVMREYGTKIDALEKKVAAQREEKSKDAPNPDFMMTGGSPFGAPPALMPPTLSGGPSPMSAFPYPQPPMFQGPQF
jgi:clathrin heavy chain